METTRFLTVQISVKLFTFFLKVVLPENYNEHDTKQVKMRKSLSDLSTIIDPNKSFSDTRIFDQTVDQSLDAEILKELNNTIDTNTEMRGKEKENVEGELEVDTRREPES